MKRLHILALCLLCLAAFDPAIAQEASELRTETVIAGELPKTLGPEIVKEEGLPLTLRFRDGREAQSMTSERITESAELPIRFNENTCDYQAAFPNCRIRVNFALSNLSVAWSKHQDPNKIGKSIVVEGFNVEIRRSNFEAAETQLFGNGSIQLPLAEIQCDSLSAFPIWPNGDLRVTSWKGERMGTNTITRQPENRTDSSLENVIFKKIAPNKLQLQSIAGFQSDSPRSSPSLFSGDVTALLIEKPDGDYCEISMGFDTSKVLAGFQQLEQKVIALKLQPLPFSAKNSLFFEFPLNSVDKSALYFQTAPPASGSADPQKATYIERRVD